MIIRKLCSFLILSGLLLMIGLAGAEDMAMELGEAGRPLLELVLLELSGVIMITIGIAGLNRKENLHV